MLKYKKGDVTKANECPDGYQFLFHVCNSRGVAGSGVVVSIRKNHPGTLEEYEDWYENRRHKCKVRGRTIDFDLGEVQFARSKRQQNTFICNAIGQKSPGQYKEINGKEVPPIRLWAVKEAMLETADIIRELSALNEVKIIAPKFGSLRAGASWNDDIVPLINECWKDLDVTIFEYEE